jgi:hypothetical protein
MAQHLACPPYPVAKLGALIPPRFVEALEHNQLIRSCCRHPENHTIEAWFSSDDDRDRGVPDIYIFTCTCGRKHRRFCVGGSIGAGPDAAPEPRPFWEVR